MNKKEQRKRDLERHYATLERLSEFLGHKQEGSKLSLKLWKIEQEAHRAATDYCNGANGMDSDTWELCREKLSRAVEKVFNCAVPGLLINGDARGYALKIDDVKVREYYPQEIGLYRDWGGYGILSPEIGG